MLVEIAAKRDSTNCETFYIACRAVHSGTISPISFLFKRLLLAMEVAHDTAEHLSTAFGTILVSILWLEAKMDGRRGLQFTVMVQEEVFTH